MVDDTFKSIQINWNFAHEPRQIDGMTNRFWREKFNNSKIMQILFSRHFARVCVVVHICYGS